MSDTGFKFSFGDSTSNEEGVVEVTHYSLMMAEDGNHVRFKFVDLIDGTSFPKENPRVELSWKTIAKATATNDVQTNDWSLEVETLWGERPNVKFTFTNKDKSIKLEDKMSLLATESGTVVLEGLKG